MWQQQRHPNARASALKRLAFRFTFEQVMAELVRHEVGLRSVACPRWIPDNAAIEPRSGTGPGAETKSKVTHSNCPWVALRPVIESTLFAYVPSDSFEFSRFHLPIVVCPQQGLTRRKRETTHVI